MKVDCPKKNDFQSVFPDAEEMQRLFEAVKGTRLELPVLVAAFYGLRRGEVVGLKWDAIDFERGTLTVKRTVTSISVDGKTKIYEQESAKTKSSLRTLPLVGTFREYFSEVKAAQEVNKQVCGNCYNYGYDGYAFVDEMGGLMNPNFLTNYFPEYIQKHAIKKVRFHDLKPSACKRRTGEANSGVVRAFGFQHNVKYLCASGLRFQAVLGTGNGDGMTLPKAVDFSSKWAFSAAENTE